MAGPAVAKRGVPYHAVMGSGVWRTVVLAVVLAGSGCATTAGPTSSEPATPSPAPTVEPQTAPSPQFPIDCAEALPDSLIEEVTGLHTDWPAPSTDPYELAVARQRGSFGCLWMDLEAGFRIDLSVTRDSSVRAAAGEYPADAEWTGALGIPESFARCGDGDSPRTVCNVGAVVGDYVLTAYSVVPLPAADAEAGMNRIYGPIVAALLSRPVPPRWAPDVDDWPVVYDCGALDGRVSMDEASGVVGLTVIDASGRFDDHRQPREIAALGGETSCQWSAPDDAVDPALAFVRVRLLAGGGWLFDELLPTTASTVEEIVIAGADEAAFVCRTAEACVVLLRIGSNAVQIEVQVESFYGGSPPTREQLLAVATAVAPALAP